MKTLSIDIEIDPWLHEGGINIPIYALGKDDPVCEATFELLPLVWKEISMYCIPATARSIKDVEELRDNDRGIQKLRDNLQECVNLLDKALSKAIEEEDGELPRVLSPAKEGTIPIEEIRKAVKKVKDQRK